MPTLDVDFQLQLKVANTALDRSKLLPKDSNLQRSHSTPSHLVALSMLTPPHSRPGMAVAILNLGPRSMLPPHIHPRVTNFVVTINGTTDTYISSRMAPESSQTLTQT